MDIEVECLPSVEEMLFVIEEPKAEKNFPLNKNSKLILFYFVKFA
jgi:hypothetical protein